MQSGNKSDAIAARKAIVDSIFELPVHVIDQDKHTRPQSVAAHKHVMPGGDKMVSDPGDKLTEALDVCRRGDGERLGVAEQGLEPTAEKRVLAN